jgi:hypothetical protein
MDWAYSYDEGTRNVHSMLVGMPAGKRSRERLRKRG